MTRRTTTLAGSLTLALVLAACGGGAAAPDAATSPPEAGGNGAPAETSPPEAGASDAAAGAVLCATLLPAAEAEAIIGTTPTTVNVQEYPGGAGCTWNYTDANGQSQYFQIVANVDDDSGLWTATKDAAMDNDFVDTAASVAGAGDESYAWIGQGDYRKLYVRRGAETIAVSGPVVLAALADDAAMAELADTLFGRF